jgi:hypothetical protein
VKYLLLICGDESAAAHAEDGCGGWTEEMERRGVLDGAAGLRPPTDATTVRVRDDSVHRWAESRYLTRRLAQVTIL